jgi:hypothetical protein
MKLAQSVLATAMLLATCANVHAMEALDDDSMAGTTGQAGITFYTNLNITNSVFTYQDTDGLANAGSTTANSSATVKAYSPAFAGFAGTGQGGDMNVRNLGMFSSSIQAGAAYTNLAANAAPMVATIDVGANSGGQAVLNLGISIPQLNVSFSGIDVCQATVTTTVGPCASGASIITSPSVDLVIQNLTMNFQLGNSAQGHLALISNGATPISLALGTANSTNKIVIVDPNNTNGGIGVGLLSVTGLDLGDGSTNAKSTFLDACSNTITTNCGTSANPGLLLSFGSSTMSSVGMFMQNVTLGDTSAGTPSPAIGNVALTGVNLGGTSVRIVGH